LGSAGLPATPIARNKPNSWGRVGDNAFAGMQGDDALRRHCKQEPNVQTKPIAVSVKFEV
jgi:hypothetical protein